MRQHYLTTHFILMMSLFLAFPAALLAQGPSIQAQYSLISKKRLSRTVSEYTFKATLINGDTAIKNVSATATSNSSFTTVIDDDLSFNDMEAGATGESSDTFIIQQDRREAFGPESLSWNVGFESDIQSDLEIDGIIDATRVITMRENKKSRLTTYFRFSDKEKQTPFTLSLSQVIEPNVGLSLTPILNGEEYFDDDRDGRIHQQSEQLITATQPGNYTITTTATVVETGKKFSDISKVKVYGIDELSIHPALINLGTTAIVVNTVKQLNVTVGIGGEDSNEITQAVLKEIHQGWEFPLQLNDYRYETQIEIDTHGVPVDTVYEFIV